MAAAILLLAACSRNGSHTPATTTATTTPGPRIISTVPAATLNLVLLGAADRLVGVTRYDDIILPDPQKNLPVVGDYETMDYERLITLHPSALVIQTAEARLSPRLQNLAASHNIQLVNIKLDTLDDLWTTIDQLGQISGKQLAATRAIATAKADLDALRSQTQSLPHPRTLYALSQNPVMIVGNHTFVDQMLSIAGADNVGKTIGNAYPIVGLETVVKLAPDVLLISAPGEPAQTPDDPRLAKWLQLPIPAARNHRIYLITDPNSLMASLNVAQNVRDIAQLLHPDLPPASESATQPPPSPTQPGAL
jgi:iron complex transport system substrate-binding protein